MRRTVFASFTILSLLVISCMSGLVFITQTAKAMVYLGPEPVFIRADGSIYPLTAPIRRDGNTYTFTDDIINGSIVIGRANIVLDGNGHVLQGDPLYYGLIVRYTNNVTIKNLNIKGFGTCLHLEGGEGERDVTIASNNITDGGFGIVSSFVNTVIFGNNITNNKYTGIFLYGYNNLVFENNIADNEAGIYFGDAGCNSWVFHNNFLNNTSHCHGCPEWFNNDFDADYPSGGNYWSDYNGTDSFGGPFQNETGRDGIGDTGYMFAWGSSDNYPLMGKFSDFTATPELHVQTVCNSTISSFQFNGTAIRFNVIGESGTDGFCRICVPTALISAYRVFVNGTEVSSSLLPCSNSTHSYLYFNYTHSTQEVIIIPEFPSFLILLLFMTPTLSTLKVCRRKRR